MWASPNELIKRMSEAGDLFPWQNVPGELKGSHLKTAGINQALVQGTDLLAHYLLKHRHWSLLPALSLKGLLGISLMYLWSVFWI